jgi:hypothetical protein
MWFSGNKSCMQNFADETSGKAVIMKTVRLWGKVLRCIVWKQVVRRGYGLNWLRLV